MKRILSIIAVFTILALFTGAFAMPAFAVDDGEPEEEVVVVVDEGDPDADPDDGGTTVIINFDFGKGFARACKWFFNAWAHVVAFFKNLSGLSFIFNFVF